jgi:hypothetical protein
MKSILGLTVAAMLCLIGTGGTPGKADVLFQSIPDLTVAPNVNAYCSSCNGSWQVFDTFTLSSASTVQTITFAADNYTVGGWPVSVDVSIWSLNGSLPGSKLFDQNFTPAQFTSISYTSMSYTPYATAIVTVAVPIGILLQALTTSPFLTLLISEFRHTLADLRAPDYNSGPINLHRPLGRL